MEDVPQASEPDPQSCISCLGRAMVPEDPIFWAELRKAVLSGTGELKCPKDTCNQRVVVGKQGSYGFLWIEVPFGPKLEERKKIFIKLARLVQPLMESYKLNIHALVEVEPPKIPKEDIHVGFADFSARGVNFIGIELRSRVDWNVCVSFLQLISVLLHELAHAREASIRGSQMEDLHSTDFFSSLLKLQRSYYTMMSPFKKYHLSPRLYPQNRVSITPGAPEYPPKMQWLVVLRQLAFEDRLNLEFKILTRMGWNRAEKVRWLKFDSLRRIMGFGRRGFEGTEHEDYFDIHRGVVKQHRDESRSEKVEAEKKKIFCSSKKLGTKGSYAIRKFE
ncbi:hypothetical protein TWF506_004115 [Arthrobotrys conoides]|uniref:WLM domain-containing protein n=1 Tax=Arthrobotrys conoides TaxID=74498 RepID=A0AAN8N380_9PEZI